MVFEAGGLVREFVGGYEDWLHQSQSQPLPSVSAPTPVRPPAPTPTRPSAPTRRVARVPVAKTQKKLSYREQQELQKLPGEIESLEAEQQRLQTAVAAADFYKESAETIQWTLHRLEELRIALLDTYARWNELDSRATG